MTVQQTTTAGGRLAAGQEPSEPTDLRSLADELLERARSAHAGRAARTLPHPVDGLRQTVIALSAEQELAEHESPGPATLMTLHGRTRLVADGLTVEVAALQMCPIPNRWHSLHADEDSVVLLGVAVSQRALQAG